MILNVFPVFRFWLLVGLFGATGAMLWGCVGEDVAEDGGDRVMSGDWLPEFCVRMSDGSMVSPEMLRGRRSVIVFFNTSCEDCRYELPRLQEVYDEWGAEVAFVCIGREESAATVADYWRREGLSLPYSVQEDRAVYGLFAVHTIPRMYVVSAEGRVCAVFAGRTPAERLRAAIVAAAAEVAGLE